MRALFFGALLAVAVASCKGDPPAEDVERREKPAAKPAAKSATAEPTQQSVAPVDPSRPRYLRPTPQGALVDAFRFPSVPASIVEQEVATASSRGEAAGILRRFGLTSLEGRTGQVWIAKASLVDRLARERVLVVSFRSDENGEGLRDEDSWIVFVGSTEDDRVLKIGNARVKSKTTAPIAVDARELHTKDADDVVATWSSCAKPTQKACHYFRAWTMQRGYPEMIADLTSDTAAVVAPGVSPPYGVVVDGRVLKFDTQTFSYH